ncbi:pumilio homolog 12-like isoform X1 [Malus sylvestris]|uniref:pumilio homolog 12-like isoform X1 n=1 Tax=Malus sylvestris TaxID=3752 RepID=UPI0021ACBBFA|nr:pumilio homolog 12-like isoform X1 [Malus sylvestris]
MEEGRTELEFDEFEKLLGEIPNATSGNTHSDESGTKNASLSPICVNSCKGPLSEKLHNNGRIDGGRNSANKIQKSPVKRVQQDVTNLPDDQSLTSALAGLRFDGAVNMEAESHVEHSKSLQNYSFSMNGQIANSLKTQVSNMDTQVMVVPSFQAPNNIPCGFYEFDAINAGQESSNMLKFNFEELKKPQAAYSQPIENLSPGVPLAPAVQGFHFLSNVPAPGLQFPLTSDHQQQFFLDAQSRIPYLHSQQLNQNQISWRNMEEEQYYRMQQRYVYLQQLHDQRLEAQHLVQGNGNIASRLTCPTPRHPHFEVPISNRLEQSNQERIWNNYVVPRGPHQSNPALSYTDFNGIQVLDKVGKQSFPEKILTRSHGMNTLKAVKFGVIGTDEPLTHVSQNGKALPNGHFRHALSTQNTGCFQLDSLNTWGMFPSLMHLKNTDMKVLPQKYTDLKTVPQKYNSMDEITGRIYLMAKDQHGCRFLQRKFSEGAQKDVENIFSEIIDHIVELMTDPFGNYLIQKLLEVCDEDQQMQILHSITKKPGELVRISCDMHGTRAVQKVIETLKIAEQFSMVVSSLKPGIVTLIKNTNGNHVAQRCLQYLTPEYREFLFAAATTNCVELATDRHGCCVLQKCLNHSDAEQRNRLICEITSNALILSQDPFGNYVVQFVFELQLPWATVHILDQLEGNYGDLSVQKYSSNVVEKSLKYADEERRTRIIQELIENPRLDQVMQDPYGNYVVQAALSQSKRWGFSMLVLLKFSLLFEQGILHSKLVDAIKPHVSVLRTSPYGKKILSSNILKK